MVVPDRIVQAERLVALAPAVAGALVLLDDDGRYAELPQPCAERDAALAAADDERVGLRLEAEFGGFLLTLFLPCRRFLPEPCLAPIGRAKPAGSSWPFNSTMVVSRVQILPSLSLIWPSRAPLRSRN